MNIIYLVLNFGLCFFTINSFACFSNVSKSKISRNNKTKKNSSLKNKIIIKNNRTCDENFQDQKKYVFCYNDGNQNFIKF